MLIEGTPEVLKLALKADGVDEAKGFELNEVFDGGGGIAN